MRGDDRKSKGLIPSGNKLGARSGIPERSSLCSNRQDIGDMVEHMVRLDIGILFAIGGDGTLKGAQAIAGEIGRRGLKIAVIGIPKTIDNDISFIQQTFGFDTAGSEARRAIHAAHCEARGARNGIGLVKLMGRDSGFIAAYAVLANSQVNFCLVPEVPFKLEGLFQGPGGEAGAAGIRRHRGG